MTAVWPSRFHSLGGQQTSCPISRILSIWSILSTIEEDGPGIKAEVRFRLQSIPSPALS
jgi:hypothetical protein